MLEFTTPILKLIKMKKTLIATLVLITCSIISKSQISPSLPTNSKSYGSETYLSPDGLLWYGTAPFKYRSVYPKTKIDSLFALIPSLSSNSTQWAGNNFDGIDAAVDTYLIAYHGAGNVGYSSKSFVQTFADVNNGALLNNSILGNAATSTLSTNSTTWQGLNFTGASGAISPYLVAYQGGMDLGFATKSTTQTFLDINNGSTINNSISGNATTATNSQLWTSQIFTNIDVVGDSPSRLMGYYGSGWRPIPQAEAQGYMGINAGGETLQSVTDRGNIITNGIAFNGNNLGISWTNSGNNASILGENGSLRMFAGGNESIRVLANGNVGLGTTTPLAKLDVDGTGYFSGSITALQGDFSGKVTSGSAVISPWVTNSAFARFGHKDFNTGFLQNSAGEVFMGSDNNVFINGAAIAIGGPTTFSGKVITTGMRLQGTNQSSIDLRNLAGDVASGYILGRSLGTDNANDFFIYNAENGTAPLRIASNDNVTFSRSITALQGDFAGKVTSGSAVISPWVTNSTFARFGHKDFNTGFLQNSAGEVFMGSDSNVSINGATIAIGGQTTFSGNVGIGTTLPTEKLSVKGKIRAQEVKVENINWPDYVFAKSYRLPTLQETEKHIREKGHLPGIPSAGEVKANGIDVGEMNAKLLQKIEELTLHLIDMKKENEMLNKRLLKVEKKQR
ncbi:hypothetical protein FBD94_23085 [Pedobacter hiemivivus]|uniref:Peptidase S74 domain-containing protein n=1 Tax=Pedobacter hiemivivus TaxID=2530454 RepID=A0A4U1G255_9SPHI|nr:hypothetical protein [Pedobacter hiemivivus]TKC56600.1 hypothetical protein FBD94_23085 [Pedobacter hiemivivus]